MSSDQSALNIAQNAYNAAVSSQTTYENDGAETYWLWLDQNAEQRRIDLNQTRQNAINAIDATNSAMVRGDSILSLIARTVADPNASTRRVLQNDYDISDLTMIETLPLGGVPLEMYVCEDESSSNPTGVTGFVLNFGTAEDKQTGPIHGDISSTRICQQWDLNVGGAKVVSVSFYGSSSPYLEGLKIDIGSTQYTAGAVD